MLSYNPGACCRGVIIKEEDANDLIEIACLAVASGWFAGNTAISFSFAIRNDLIPSAFTGGSKKPRSITPFRKSVSWVSVVASRSPSETEGYFFEILGERMEEDYNQRRL